MAAYERLTALGLGIVYVPVPRASEPQAVGAAGSLADDTYYVAMTWVNNKGEEGAPSVVVTITTTGSTLLVQPATAPTIATGWNVYLGTDPQTLYRQNGPVIPVGQTWLQPSALTTGSSGPGCGQAPNCLMPMPRVILRG